MVGWDFGIVHPKLKFLTNSNGQIKSFPNTIPLMNPKPPKYSSSTLENLVSKTKKGRKNFRKILSRCKDFITTKLINNWGKNSWWWVIKWKWTIFKIPNIDLFDVNEKDIIYRLINQKTVFNCKHQYLYPNGQDRPDWAMEDYGWACRNSRDENNKEDLRHAVFSCPTLVGKERWS